MKKLLIVTVAILAVMAISVPQLSAEVIYACYNKISGVMRHVSGSGLCRELEGQLSWNDNGLGGTQTPTYSVIPVSITEPVNVGTTPTLLFESQPVLSTRGGTVEVTFHANAYGGVLSGGALGVQFSIRIDDNTTVTPTAVNTAEILSSDATAPIWMFALYTGASKLAAGNHTVSVWGQALPTGGSNGVILDPGDWGGGSFICKEEAF